MAAPRCRMMLRWVPGETVRRNSPPRGRCDNWGKRVDATHVHTFKSKTVEQLNEAWWALCQKHGSLADLAEDDLDGPTAGWGDYNEKGG